MSTKVGKELLKVVSRVSIPGTLGQFIAECGRIINTEKKAPVGIDYYGREFSKFFLPRNGRIHGTLGTTELGYYELRQQASDVSIIAELGGGLTSRSTLSELLFLMENQKCTENGCLLISSGNFTNVFYLSDVDDILRPVFVFPNGKGWGVNASFVEDSRGWSAGHRIFSRYLVPLPH